MSARFDLIPLHFEGNEFRVFDQQGDPWWLLNDVCRPIGIANPRQVASRLDEDEKAAVTLSDGRSGQRREMTIISEPALHIVVLRSRQATTPGTFAYRFRRWVTHEVLPSIRKFGMYPPPAVEVALDGGTQNAATPQTRFVAECQRIADENGVTVSKLLEHIISPSQLRAIELGHGPMENLLHRDKRWVAFTGLGMDLQYVLTGIWRTTPQERRVIRQLRQDSANQRLLTDGPA